jgi:AcrR family transcriptional regulator
VGERTTRGMTIAGRRERTKAANRAAILEAARDVFAELGYEAAGVRDIVRRTDLASGTFYNYFDDKDAVFVALIAESGEQARLRVREARRRARTAAEFVEGGYRAFFAFIVEEPERFAFMRRNLQTIVSRFGEQVLPAGTEELAEDLRTAIEAGHVPPVDVDYCAHAMIAVGLELGARLVERAPPDVEGATRFASTLFLGALARHESRASPVA